MTLDKAKELYIDAGGEENHSEDEWLSIHKEMEGIIAAKSDREAGKLIEWWGCWDAPYTPIAFARRVRVANGQPPQQSKIASTLDALKDIRDRALDHPVCDHDLYEKHDVDGLAEIGGDVCDWTMIAIIANDAIKQHGGT